MIDPPTTSEIRLERYQKASLTLGATSSGDLKYETTDNLLALIIRIATVEGPVHKDVVIERIRNCYGIGRVGSGNRDKIEKTIIRAQTNGAIGGDMKAGEPGSGSFIWVGDEQLRRVPRSCVDNDIGHVPPTELKTIMVAIAGAEFGVPRGALMTAVTRKMGFERTGSRITEQLEKIIQELLEEGRLVESFGMIDVQDSGRAGELGIDPPLTTAGHDARAGEGPNPTDISKSPDIVGTSDLTSTRRPGETDRASQRRKGHTKPHGAEAKQPKPEPPGRDEKPLGRGGTRSHRESLVDRLRDRGLDVIDKRQEGGGLWVVGGPELEPVLIQFEGVEFQFAPEGGRATRNWYTREKRPAWWIREQA